jgi:glutamate/tyrosine decarboxylase-like PLP-dependent enzyme
LEGNREAIDVGELEKAIMELDGKPFILVSSAGTVNTVDFDDMKSIAALKTKYSFWWHIDAAFGAFAILSKEHQHLFTGWEQADSITIDCHKWLNVPYDSAIFLVRKEYSVLQVETFQNSNAPYLGDPLENFNYLNFLPDNSRRLKALPAWFSLMAYGRDGYAKIIENNINLARQFGALLQADERFELLAPVRVNTVCFTLAGKEGQEQVSSFLENINATGKVFMTPTVYNQRKGIRAAFVNWRTTEMDVDMVLCEMRELLMR